MDFHCMKCLKFESAEEKEARIEKIKRFFSEDSQFLHFRPPTPDLSEEMSRYHKPPLM